MGTGTFDDRNDARLIVKRWLRRNPEESYRPEHIRRLVAETVLRDHDPVDPIADSWREGMYGAWIGVLEFAGEEMEQSKHGSASAAADAVRQALRHLPYQPSATLERLQSALRSFEEVRGSSDGHAGNDARAAEALRLATELLRNTATKRTVTAH